MLHTKTSTSITIGGFLWPDLASYGLARPRMARPGLPWPGLLWPGPATHIVSDFLLLPHEMQCRRPDPHCAPHRGERARSRRHPYAQHAGTRTRNNVASSQLISTYRPLSYDEHSFCLFNPIAPGQIIFHTKLH